jgi:hypothetical protein
MIVLRSTHNCPVPVPGQIGDGDGDGDRGVRALLEAEDVSFCGYKF